MTVNELFGLSRELRQLQWVAGREHAENKVIRIQFLKNGGACALMPGDLLVIAPSYFKTDGEASQTAESALRAGAAAILLGAEDEARNTLACVCGQALPLVSMQSSGLVAAVESASAALLGEAAYTGYILSQFKGKLDIMDAHIGCLEVLQLLQRYLGYSCEIMRNGQQFCPNEDDVSLQAGRKFIAERPAENNSSARGTKEYFHRYFPIQNPMGVSSHLKITLPSEDRLNPLDVRLINCVLPRLALSLLMDDGRPKRLYRDKDEFFSQSVCGEFSSNKETLAENCHLLGLPYGRRWVVWVMEFAADFEHKELVVRRAKQFFNFYGKNVLSAKDGVHIVFAVDYEGILAPQGETEELLEKLLSHITHGLASSSIKTGISSSANNAGEWQTAFQEACFALETAKKTGRERIFYANEDTMFQHLLNTLSDNPILKRMFSKTILPLKEYDQQNGGDLMETLRALAICNFNVNIAAETMYFHRNTLYKRIKKISSLLDMNLAKLESRLILQIELELCARFSE